MRRVLPILFLITFSSPGFAQRQTNSTSIDKSYEQTQIFANDKAGKPYIVLGQIIAKATQNENCIKKLQKKAVEGGGNLIINFDSGATGTQGFWTGSAVIICRGIAARWPREGEQGQSAIDPNAPMPVLITK